MESKGICKSGTKRASFIMRFFVIMFVFLVGCSNDSNEATVKTEFETSEGKVVLEKVSLLSNKLEILIPNDFSLMSEELAKIKYPMERRPNIIYTNDSGSINVTFNHTESKASKDDIDGYKDYFMELFMNLYPSAERFDDGIIQLDEKNIGYMAILSPAIDTEIYNLMFFTDLDGKLLIGSFNCVKEQMDDWELIAKNIMNSIKIIE